MFDGATYSRERDGRRLTAQLERVRMLMLDGRWRSLNEIAATTDSPQASVSARLRDLRKPKFGSYIVERKHITRGLYHYRVLR